MRQAPPLVHTPAPQEANKENQACSILTSKGQICLLPSSPTGLPCKMWRGRIKHASHWGGTWQIPGAVQVLWKALSVREAALKSWLSILLFIYTAQLPSASRIVLKAQARKPLPMSRSYHHLSNSSPLLFLISHLTLLSVSMKPFPLFNILSPSFL